MRAQTSMGRRSRRVELQSASEVASETGQVTKTWTTIRTVWGQIAPISGREVFTAHQVSADVTHRVYLDFHEADDVTAEWRLKHGTRIFEIEAVLNVEERDRKIEVWCKEVK